MLLLIFDKQKKKIRRGGIWFQVFFFVNQSFQSLRGKGKVGAAIIFFLVTSLMILNPSNYYKFGLFAQIMLYIGFTCPLNFLWLFSSCFMVIKTYRINGLQKFQQWTSDELILILGISFIQVFTCCKYLSLFFSLFFLQERRRSPMQLLAGSMLKMLQMHISRHLRFHQLVEDIVQLRELHIIRKQ